LRPWLANDAFGKRTPD